MDRRRQLKEQCKQTKPEMGVYVIESKVSGKMLVAAAQNLRSGVNGSRFKLNAGIHPNRELQDEWREHGAEQFVIRVLDSLEYSKDESKKDYTQDLEELRAMWMARLAEQNVQFYSE